MGIKLYEMKFFDYVVKNLSFCCKLTSEKESLWFFSKDLRFGILLTVDYQTTCPQVSESDFRYSGGFFRLKTTYYKNFFG